MEPTSREESKVEQILYCASGAPVECNAAKMGGKATRIQSGLLDRAMPAMPMPRRLGNRASCSGRGTSKNNTLGRPAKVKASITAAEPVKSSP